MKRTEIINRIIQKIGAKTYLEIGVQRGKNFYEIDTRTKIAVDPAFKIGITRKLKNFSQLFSNHFFEQTSDDFFRQHASTVLKKYPLDVALIDGLHTYEQSLLDFKNCLQYLAKGGVILFHDCNPTSPEAAAFAGSPEEMQKRFPGKNAEWNGDVWKTIVHIQSHYSDLETFVLNCDYGVGVVKRGKPERSLKFSSNEIEALTYEDFDKNRTSFLNLKSPAYLSEFLQRL
jgi:hypothetical protein